MNSSHSGRLYTEQEKIELINNLNFEVAHRVVQFKRELEDRLENFRMTQETSLSYIPKAVRNMTMRDFGNLYNGSVPAAVRGHQKAKFVSERGEDALEKIDKSTRKRKWVESQETDGEMSTSGSNPEISRITKSARTMPPSPNKLAGSSTGPGTVQRARLLASSDAKGRSAPSSPSPQKMRPPFNSSLNPNNRTLPRPVSPAKTLASKASDASLRQRVPSSATFNPALSKTTSYPRYPLKDDNKGGSHNVFAAASGALGDGKGGTSTTSQTLRRTKSTINVRRDPSFATHVVPEGAHLRTVSQTSIYSSTQDSSTTHSRTNSQATTPPSFELESTQPDSLDITPTRPASTMDLRPNPAMPFPSLARSYSVTISTKDGHLLEFDPLQTSPGALDALEGITTSAKKQARQDMGRLMQAVVDKWKITP
ncbi:hypothetical protein C8J56DRAFT_1020014 [Mycena floridula]|nr:hypothetical protein C8J56DRAFT_1020014 [Mycena floridula]